MKKRSITLTYNADANDDGTGAQIQRILGIYSVSRKYGFNYLHTPVKNLLVFPLDSSQDPHEVEKYLKRMNDYFKLPTDDSFQFDKIISMSAISVGYLRRLNTQMHFGKPKKILVRVSNPGLIVDTNPDILRFAVSDLNQPSAMKMMAKVSIVLHIRGTVQEDLVIKGEVEPRSLPVSYYKDKLRGILALIDADLNYEIKVFTDIPKKSLSFEPRPQDIETWNKSGHSIVDGKIQVDGLDLEKDFQEFGSDIEFIYGGDPLDAIIQMSHADYFVMSRSSFSYLAAILNRNGMVYYPPKFWHPPLANWILG
jgi:hypothetical protein